MMVGGKLLQAIGQDAAQMLVLEPRQSNNGNIQAVMSSNNSERVKLYRYS